VNLVLALADGSEVQLPVPAGMSAEDVLHAFTRKRAPFNDDWIEIDARHFVRYSTVVDVRVEEQSSNSA
jgi:hypothetical protein